MSRTARRPVDDIVAERLAAMTDAERADYETELAAVRRELAGADNAGLLAAAVEAGMFSQPELQALAECDTSADAARWAAAVQADRG